MDKWEYSYLTELEKLWEKEKLLITSSFFFSHNVFKSCVLLMRQNEYLWSKGLKHKKIVFQMVKTDRIASLQKRFLLHTLFLRLSKKTYSIIILYYTLQAMGIMTLPPNAPEALSNLLNLTDEIWYYAGDRSTDVSTG